MEVNTKKGLLHPEILFSAIYDITPDFLREQDVRGIVFDIDNTIAPYEISEPTDAMKEYLFSLRDCGIQVAFVSNNRGGRVEVFNRSLGFPCFCKAKKPLPGGVKAAIRAFGLPKDQVLSIGDQLFTDCMSAHLAGIRFFIVPPIRDKKTLLFRVKRALEKPFLKSFRRYGDYAAEARKDPPCL